MVVTALLNKSSTTYDINSKINSSFLTCIFVFFSYYGSLGKTRKQNNYNNKMNLIYINGTV